MSTIFLIILLSFAVRVVQGGPSVSTKVINKFKCKIYAFILHCQALFCGNAIINAPLTQNVTPVTAFCRPPAPVIENEHGGTPAYCGTGEIRSKTGEKQKRFNPGGTEIQSKTGGKQKRFNHGGTEIQSKKNLSAVYLCVSLSRRSSDTSKRRRRYLRVSFFVFRFSFFSTG